MTAANGVDRVREIVGKSAIAQDAPLVVVDPAKGEPPWLWAPPLDVFLGDEEPSDDDAEDWTIRDLIPRGEPFLFAGAWKSGKTWTAISLAACIALGRPFLGFENCLGRPGRVLLIALEDGRRRMRKRVWQVLRGLGLSANEPAIREFLRVWDHMIRIPGDAKEVARFAAEMNRWRPDVIIIDSLTRAMTGSQNDIRDATAFTAVWRDLSIATGAAIGFLHHTNKGNGDDKRGPRDPFNSVRGSGELLAAPRNLIVMERLGADDSKVSAVSMRGNLELRRSSFALEWVQEERADGRVAVTLQDRGEVDDLKREATEQKKAAKQTEKERKDDRITRTALQMAQGSGAVSATGLAAVLAVNDRTAARYLVDLRGRGLLGDPSKEGSPITEAGSAYLGRAP